MSGQPADNFKEQNMNTRVFTASLIALSLFTGASLVSAADRDQDRDRVQQQDQENVYGWQLMTEQERAEHRAKMRSFKTEQEREQYRMEHHERMEERARERGVTLPQVPQKRGQGMGPGNGMGGGMGPGGGMGRGR